MARPRLAPHDPALAQRTASAVPSVPSLPLGPRHGILALCLGGWGQAVGAALVAAEAAQGRAIPVCGLDNDEILRPEMVLPDGIPCPFPAARWLRLSDDVPRRTRIREHPTLRAHFETSGLLASLPVSFDSAAAGHGGGADPRNSLIDLLLHLARVRSHLRDALESAVLPPSPAGAGVLGALLQRQQAPAPGPLEIVVVAGGTGSFGAGTAPFVGYLLRQEAAGLGLPRPRIWLLLGGPNAFREYTERWRNNFGMTLQALEHLSVEGIDLPTGDGPPLVAAEPPYDRIWLLDEPGQRAKPSEPEARAFAWHGALAAQLLLSASVRAVYLGHDVNVPHEEGRIGLGTLALGVGGVDRAALTRLLADELATRRAAALAELLRTVA